MAKKDDKKLLTTARERFLKCVEADRENRKLAVDDLRFLHEPGAQWDQVTKDERGTRSCFEFNKLRISVKRVINDIRANRPQGKVRAVEDNDQDTSSIMEGLCRNVWTASDGDAAIDTAAEYQVGGGMGAWRINTRYSTDDAWDQDIILESIRNPFSLWADPSARDPMKRDAEYWFLESRMSKDGYEAKYGKVPSVEWEASEFEEDDSWQDDDRVRICEYWYREPVTKTLILLDDGSSIDAEQVQEAIAAGRKPQRSRTVNTHKVCMAIISGDKILEGPTDWAGAKFPFVQVYGEYVVIDGKPKWWGLTRHSKDAQRMHNAMLTNALETAALAPQAKWWATATQAQGNTDNWARAHKENLPFLVYNPDPMAPGAPAQMNGAQVPAAFVNLAMFTSEEIKATTGIFDASLGNKSNEQTGIAIRARQQQGEIANFNYGDNIARGIRYTWELLIDLIPKIYDTQRTIRTIGSDGAEDYAKINTIDPQTGETVNDLSKGKYDVTVTVGPSFSTQRQEAAEIYMGLTQANPNMFPIVGDLIFKSLDLPYAQDMAERMQAMLPPPIQQMIQAKSANGNKLPPEVTAAMAQVQQAQEMVTQHGQLVQQAAQEAEQEQAAAQKAKAEVQTAIAQLKVEEANLQRMKAEFDAHVAQTQVQLHEHAAGLDSQAKDVEMQRKDVEHAGKQMETNAMQQGEQAAADMVQKALDQVTQAIAKLEQSVRDKPQAPIVISPPRVKGIKKTSSGHQVEYDD